MTKISVSEAAKAVVRRNTEEVQGGGNFEVFEELFADDFLDHTPQPGRTPDKGGARQLYKILRAAFPDFHADIHWQSVAGDLILVALSLVLPLLWLPALKDGIAESQIRAGGREENIALDDAVSRVQAILAELG